MSSSDKVKDDFKPIDLSALENHDEEKINRDKKSEPDWDKFKVFYKDLKSEQEETDLFKGLFDLGKEEKSVFEQFGEEKSKKGVTEEGETGSGRPEEIIDKEIKESEHRSVDENADELIKESPENEKKIPESELTPDEGYEQAFEKGKKDGYEKGFEQGEKEGKEKGAETGYSEGYTNGESKAAQDIEIKIAEKTEEFKEMLLKLDNAYIDLAKRYEEKIISLICKIAEKVVLAKVEIDDEIVKNTVLDAINTLPEPEDIILSVSNEDYEYIEMVKEDLFEFIKTLKSVSVKSDTSVNRGGCRIETKEGYVEADIEVKLEKVFSSIKGEHLS
jgi:flagellar assembly protein FliH